ncbi:GNAT family N-acetyltransferase [Brevibacillus porteri]|uniref:GNAT family N-acetyltransferase n=1 Tax=Brevibacillus porteri TaxID=2126350 RepID=A0ABX5FRK6_9BACL|nr:GNAT family N-acetyltransferase [Brevibacillus porteri]MED1798114.1 GNAT family N-acetyltransferase [Brevibacillus porteri]MED2132051.1 GNAT family N-acetyltransferase [Brevibacillus porteri]MED2742614.1 GNAT family N-acetyltransferase [Brevibacillus porteri]MED2814090.1 GNAT family N-acetyltransferase [Brevibacillus porteri]MED2893651.1 GNAT family N-acetyltransferase [Brevibacillus porteri]
MSLKEWLHVVAATSEDQSFQYQVYASTRVDEIDSWGWGEAQQEAFLRMQFAMQQQAYQFQFPKAHYQLIVADTKRVGHLLIDRTEHELHLVDIALLPEYRNKGIGTFVMKKLQDEAAQQGKPLKLQVMKLDVASHLLYERLGFACTGEYGMHIEMEWSKRGS